MYDFMYPSNNESDVIDEHPLPDLYKERRLEAIRAAELKALTDAYSQPLVNGFSALSRNNPLLSANIQNDEQNGNPLISANISSPVSESTALTSNPVPVDNSGQAPISNITSQSTVGTTALPDRNVQPVQSNGGKSLSADVQQWRPMVTEIAKKYGIDPDKALTIMQIESGGKAGITNQKGAPYGGLFQISTKVKGWNDPRINTETALKQMAQRTNMFKKAFGREPSAGELYLMQQQGEGGAMALLNPKNANRPVEQVLAEVGEWKRKYGGDPNKVLNHVVKTNGGSAGMTAAQFASKWVGKANNVYGNSGTVAASNGSSKPTQVAQRKVLTQEAKPQSKKEYKRQVLNDEASNIKAQMDEVQKHMSLPNVNQATFNALQSRFKDLKLTYDAINRENGRI